MYQPAQTAVDQFVAETETFKPCYKLYEESGEYKQNSDRS